MSDATGVAEPGVADDKPGLSLSQAVAVGVNTTSPAYSLAAILAPMALLVGYSAPVVLLVSFVPMGLTSLAFMYLNRRDPDCGTTFSWVTRSLGGNPGFLAGWLIAACGVLLIGSLAETAVRYTFLTFGLNGLAENRMLLIACASLLIVVMVGLSIAGADSSITLQSVITYVQVLILLGFGVAAGVEMLSRNPPELSSDWINPLSHGPQALTAAMLLGVFAFWGWEAATNLSEECEKSSDAGKAGVISTLILVGTYLVVAVSVVMYLAPTNFESTGTSGLVLVDMSQEVLGPLSFLVLLAIAVSALASTQTTMVPGSRAVLSMARRGALPARLGLLHPRYKSPYASLGLLAGLAVIWYVGVSIVSENALEDTLSSLGILVALYYSVTGISCVVYYRRHVVGSLKGLILVGLGPLIGSFGLAVMLVVAVQSVSNPADSATGVPWFGLAPPLFIAGTVIVVGVIVLVWQRLVRPAFFIAPPSQPAGRLKSPFYLDHERTLPTGGVLVDCNRPADEVVTAIAQHSAQISRATPYYLVFGIEPTGVSGEEYDDAMEALAEDGSVIFAAARAALVSAGAITVFDVYDPTHHDEVAPTAARLQAAETW